MPEAPETPEDRTPNETERALLAELTCAETELSGLADNLRGLDAELEALEVDGDRYDRLQHVLEELERLQKDGAAELFWGEQAHDTAPAHIDGAYRRIATFRESVEALQEKRRAALGEIDDQHVAVELLDDNLYREQQAEERRRREWLLERESSENADRRIAMPWMRGFEDDVRFRKTLAASALSALLLALLLPMIKLPIPELEELTEIPERVAQVVRKEPPPPPTLPEPVPKKEVAEEKPAEPDPETPPEPTPQVAEAEPAAPSPAEKVRSAGILAFSERLSSLSVADPSARLGSRARVSNGGEAAAGRPTRAMVTAQGTGSSGGINLASLSRDVVGGTGGALSEGVELGDVESGIAGGGPGDRPLSVGANAGRTDEEIQIVFDRYKAALYRLYNRELRKDPTLRGQMVLKLTIEPDGTVSLCALQSSDMRAPTLADQVISSVSGFQFGAKDVPPVTILYPIDFLPTA